MGLMLTYVPEGQRARYLAVYSLGFAGATVVGPPLVGLALTRQPWSWPCLAGLFLVVSLAAWTLPAGNARTPKLSNVVNHPAVTTTERRTVVMDHGYEVFHPDPSTVAGFYVNVLGFTADEENNRSDYITVHRDDLRVGCSQDADAPLTPRKPPAGSEIVLRIDDVYAEHDRAKATGWDIEDPLQKRPWGLIDFRVFDPTGQYIRVTDAKPRD
jgi:predicted enzyme related to lactoylglutathione lyase